MSRGIPEALALLTQLANPDLGDVLAEESKQLVEVAQVYPPERPGQTYRRTGTLKGGWEPIAPRRAKGGWTAGARNEVDYADYVMGDDQAAVHHNRWRTTDQIAEAEEGRIADAIEAWFARFG